MFVQGLLYIGLVYYSFVILEYICLRFFSGLSETDANKIVSDKYFGGE